jgi:hypothetical protein
MGQDVDSMRSGRLGERQLQLAARHDESDNTLLPSENAATRGSAPGRPDLPLIARLSRLGTQFRIAPVKTRIEEPTMCKRTAAGDTVDKPIDGTAAPIDHFGR